MYDVMIHLVLLLLLLKMFFFLIASLQNLSLCVMILILDHIAV